MKKSTKCLLLAALILVAPVTPLFSAEPNINSKNYSKMHLAGGGIFLLGALGYILYKHNVTPEKAWEFTKKSTKKGLWNFAVFLKEIIFDEPAQYTKKATGNTANEHTECPVCFEELKPASEIIIGCPSKVLHKMCRDCAQETYGTTQPRLDCIICQQKVSPSFLADHNQGKLLECSFCYEEKPHKTFITLSCGHKYIYCVDCLTTPIDLAIKEQSTISYLKCDECQTPISEHDLRKITSPDKVNTIGIIRTKEWLAKEQHVKYCPTPDCSNAFINDNQLKQLIECRECKHEYCSECLVYHDIKTLSCEDAQKNKTEDNKKSDEQIKKTTKPCPKCKTRIERNNGCLYISCTQCKHNFCWNCYGSHHVEKCNSPTVNPQ